MPDEELNKAPEEEFNLNADVASALGEEVDKELPVDFQEMDLVLLKRKNVDKREYMIYSNSEEHATIEAKTVILALEASDNKDPEKVVRANTRIADVLAPDVLEYFEQDADSDIKDGEGEGEAGTD